MQKTPAKSLESRIWTAARSIRGARDAAKYRDYILPRIFTKRPCDVFDGDFNATTHGQRNPADDRLSNLIAAISTKRLGLAEVEADIIGRSYEPRGARQTARQGSPKGDRGSANQYLLRKLAEGSGQSTGAWSGATGTTRQGCPEGERGGVHPFDTPPEAGTIMAFVLASRPGMEAYVPTCGSGGLILKCQNGTEQQKRGRSSPRGGEKEPAWNARTEGGHSCPPDPNAGWKTRAPLKLYAQEKRESSARSGQPQLAHTVMPRRKRPHQFVPEARAMANMNMIIHDMEGKIEIGDTFKNPKFRNRAGKLRTFDRVVANPMWNQDWFTKADYDADELGRFPAGAGFPGKSSADWGWVQHMHASFNEQGCAAVVLDTGASPRDSGSAGTNKERTFRQWFVDHDLIESVLYLPENLFYNTTAPGIVLFLKKAKPKARQGKVFLVNASQVFEKGDPKNFIPDAAIERLADTLIGWKEEEKLSRIVEHAELKKNDYNISPSRYIHTSDAETYRPIAEIVEELKVIEAEARETDKALKEILEKLGV